MTNANLTKKLNELKEMEVMQKEITDEISKLKDEIKKEMVNRESSDLKIGQYHITYKPVVRPNFQQKEFRKAHEDIYNLFCNPKAVMTLNIR